MNHTLLKKFAIKARNDLMEQVGTRLAYPNELHENRRISL